MKFNLSENKFAYLIIVLLTLISTRFVYNIVINGWPEYRLGLEKAILSGNAETPYQYRILKPMLGHSIGTLLEPFVKDELSNHLLSYKILAYITFFFLYWLFYLFLRNFYTERTAVVGLLLLQVVIPLSLSNQWQEGDFMTAVFYLLALIAMFKNKDYFLPLIIAAGALNRDQVVFIIVLYAAYLIDRKRLFEPKSITVIILSVAAFAAVYFGLRFYFGFKPVRHTIAFNTSVNIGAWSSTLRLWCEQVFIFVIFCLMAYKKSRPFLKYSFLSLILYTLLFFMFGIMGELAKYLPAYIIMITMGIQLVNKEYTADRQEKVLSG